MTTSKILFILLFGTTSFAQITFSTFPKISYGELYQLGLGGSHWADSGYYYKRLNELGMNYVVTQADDISMNNKYEIKVIDTSIQSDSVLFTYCWSSGNDNSNLPFEVGGDIAIHGEDEKSNFGFGHQGQTSWWAAEKPVNMIITGDRNKADKENRIVFYAGKNNPNHLPGCLLFGQTNELQTWYGSVNGNKYQYSIVLTARIEGDYEKNTDTIAVVKIWERVTEPDAKIPVHDTTVFFLTPANFNGTEYVDINVGSISKKNSLGSNLAFTVFWTKKCSMYIDKYSFHDQYYENLFLADDSVRQKTREIIKNRLLSNKYFASSNPLYAHIYIDEALPMYFSSIDYVSKIALALSGGKYYINGALVGGLLDHDLRLAEYKRPDIPYIMSDNYPFKAPTDTSTKAVQNVIDNYIFTEEKYAGGIKRTGLREWIDYANNFNSNPADDRPFVQTLQVQEEKIYENGKIVNEYLRAVRPSEIMLQGWLSLCYGAKGLMYYTPATVLTPFGGNKILYTWGLMNFKGHKSGDPNFSYTLPMEPNDRFYAVKSLNAQIDKIGSELLKLSWVKGYSINKEKDSLTLDNGYIKEIKSSSVTGNEVNQDLPGETFVELGIFKKTSNYNDPNLEYFILVNRRCSYNENRNIKVSLNKNGSSYTNWGVKDLGGKNQWTLNQAGDFTDNFEPGIGKLYRFAPVVLFGGDLNFDETIKGTCSNSSELTIKKGAKLTINGVYMVQNNIYVEKGGYLIIAGGGKIIYQNGAKLIKM